MGVGLDVRGGRGGRSSGSRLGGEGGQWFFIPQGELKLELDNYLSKFAIIILDSEFILCFPFGDAQYLKNYHSLLEVGIYTLHSSAKSTKLSGNPCYFPLLSN